MSVFRKSTFIVGPTQIANYGAVVAGNIALPAYLPSIGYGTQLTINCAPGNISAINFTVTGSFNGIPIEETIQGPDNGSSSSNYFYDKITSLTADGNSATAYSISTGAYSIVVFDSYNTNNISNFNYNTINVLARSITAGIEGWGNGNYFVYGISGKRPDVINSQYVTANLTYDPNPPGNLISGYPPSNRLTFINDIMDNITQLNLKNGYFVNTTYPYDSVIVYLTNVLATPTFLEITQS